MNEGKNDDFIYEHGMKEAIMRLEERVCNLDDPEPVIKAILQTLSEYYGAEKAYIIETDFETGYGSSTYEWCAEGVAPRNSIFQYLEVNHFPQWKEAFEKKQPVVISSVETIKSICMKEYEFYKEHGVVSVIAIPYSKLSLRGYISVNNPTRHRADTTFLRLMSHGIVLELNEIRMNKTLQAAARQVPLFSPRDIYISCFEKLEIRTSIGTLTDEQFSDQMYGLIGCLALMPNHNASVQQIASFLWPDDTCETPARNIGRIIYRLKPLLSIVDIDDLIVNKGNRFSFDAKYHIMVDINLFETICNELKNGVSRERAILLYQTALRIYRGDLLPRFANVSAVMPYTVYYQNRYLSIQKKVIELTLEHQDYETAQKVIISTLQNAPYDPMAHLYMLILMLIQNGKSVGRAYYDKVKNLLPPNHDEIIRKYYPNW